MAEKSKSAVTAGIVLGILFLIAALVQNAWWVPIVLPLLCGVLAVYLASRKAPVTVGEGAKFGAVAGVTGGLMLVVIGAPLVYFVVRSSVDIEAQVRQTGLNLPGGGLWFLVIYTLVYAVVGVVLASVGGLIAAPVFGKRERP
jgi:hypothetical protein